MEIGMNQEVIQLNQVTFCYQHETEEKGANKGDITSVMLSVHQGEFLVIGGRSGCGKTTISKCINGLIPHFECGNLQGNIYVNGQNTREMDIGRSGMTIGSVLQDPRSQFFTTTVFDELAFGCRNMGFTREEILNRIDRILKEMDIEDLRQRNLLTLSSGEKQKVAIAACYCMRPGIFLFDEPSANLDPAAIKNLSVLLKRLKDTGHTILVLEHRFSYLTELLDRFVLMENGKICKVFTRDSLGELQEDRIKAMGLRSFTKCEQKLEKLVEKEYEDTGEKNKAYLELSHLGFRYRKGEKEILHDVNLKVNKGEVLAMIGENGVGKSTFAKLLTGLLKEQTGSIRLYGKDLSRTKRSKEVYYVLQDSDYQLFAESVEHELMLGLEYTSAKLEQLEQMLSIFNLQSLRNKHPMALSRGQKQRVTIAAAMMSNAGILILDEPSSGLDGENMRRLAEVIRRMAAMGRTIIIISHDFEFIPICCQRVIRLEEGELNE